MNELFHLIVVTDGNATVSLTGTYEQVNAAFNATCERANTIFARAISLDQDGAELNTFCRSFEPAPMAPLFKAMAKEAGKHLVDAPDYTATEARILAHEQERTRYNPLFNTGRNKGPR